MRDSRKKRRLGGVFDECECCDNNRTSAKVRISHPVLPMPTRQYSKPSHGEPINQPLTVVINSNAGDVSVNIPYGSCITRGPYVTGRILNDEFYRDLLVGHDEYDLGWLCGKQTVEIRFTGHKYTLETIRYTLCNLNGNLSVTHEYGSTVRWLGQSGPYLSTWQQICVQLSSVGLQIGGGSSGPYGGFTYGDEQLPTFDLSDQNIAHDNDSNITCSTCGGSSFSHDPNSGQSAANADAQTSPDAYQRQSEVNQADFTKPLNLKVEIRSAEWFSIVEDLRTMPNVKEFYGGDWSTFSVSLSLKQMDDIMRRILPPSDYQNWRAAMTGYQSGTVIEIYVEDPGYGNRSYVLMSVVE